ncbi:MAG: helix-turn-helix domain-containing protein [Acidimicrobiales bacterium]
MTVAWVLLVTNAFNIVDNIDGLSAGLAANAAGSFFVISLINTQFLVSALAMAVVGEPGSSGFLQRDTFLAIMPPMTPSLIVRGARGAAHVSQRELARLSGIPQPSISEIERGRRDPTVQTVNRILRPLGAQLTWVPTGRLTAAAAAERIARHLSAGRGRLLIERPILQLADDLAVSCPALRAALTVCPPERTGGRKYDAAIAALVEYRLNEVGFEAPGWAHDPKRIADPEWLVCDVPQLAALVRADTPEPFLRRGVLLGASDLVSV